MGTISQKIEYLNETKQRQKNLINALGGNITNDTPFREYEKELVGVLPKVTGEGTNISLSPTIEYDLEIDSYKGDIEQETLEGYNLYVGSQDFSGTWNNESLWDDVTEEYNGLVVKKKASQWGGLSKDIELEVGTYTFSLYAKSDTARACSFYVGGGTANIYPTSATANVTTTWTRYYFTFNVTSAGTIKARLENTTDGGTTNYTYICGYQLVSGSSMKDYEPYCGGIPSPNPNYPQDIKIVTGEQVINVRGKNLLKPTLQANGTNFIQARCSVTLQDDEFTFVASGSDMYLGSVASQGTSYTNNLGYLIELPSNASKIWVTFTNTSFTGSYITWFDENKISLGYGLVHQTGDSVVSGAKYCVIRIGMANSVSGTTYKTKLMVNEGSNASTYEPYKTPITKNISLGDLELAKIGSYQDYIYYDNGKWYKYGAIGKYNFIGDNTEGWALSANYTNNSRFSEAIIVANKTYTNCLSNYFIKGTAGTDTVNIDINGSNGRIMITIPNTIATTVTELTTWLSTNNTIVYYILEEASTTEITNETLLSDLEYIRTHAMSYSGTTNISSSGNLPVIISARALKGE